MGHMCPPKCWETSLNSPDDEINLDLPEVTVNNFEWKKPLWMCRLSHRFNLAALEWVGGLTSPHQYLGVNGHGATSACNDQPFTARGSARRAWLYCVPPRPDLSRTPHPAPRPSLAPWLWPGSGSAAGRGVDCR